MSRASSFSRYPWWRRWFGSRSESAAARYLRSRGHRILAHNVNAGPGELDLITLDQRTLVIVEVRSTEADDTQRIAESINAEKQRRLTQAALAWLQQHRLLGQPARFDVLLLSWPPGHREPRIEHYPHAFEAVGRFQMFS